MGPLATVEASNFKFGTKLVWGIAYQKQCFGPKFVVVWARRASKKIGIPYLFLQPLKPATSNLIRNLGLGVRYRKTMFRTKIGGVWARGASKKIGTPYLFLQPLKPSSLVHNLGLGVAYQKLTLSTKIGMVLARGAFTKFWTLTFLQPLKLATSNLVHNLV